MKRALSTSSSSCSPSKRVKENPDESNYWKQIASIALTLSDGCAKRYALQQRISKIHQLLSIPQHKNWILYTCTWWRMIMLYHDSEEKQLKLQLFYNIIQQQPKNVQQLYDVLLDIVKEKHIEDMKYMTDLERLDEVYGKV